MSRRLAAILSCLVLAACQQQPEPVAVPVATPVDPRALTDAEKKAITDEILRNWDMEVLKGCPWGDMPPVQLLIRLSPEAAVTGIERPVATDDAPCTRTAYESAEQAVRVSSPLNIPAGKIVPYVRLRLTPVHVTW
ncbi:MAG TPA: hypothetical protein VG742_00895 [Dongiaceae bacterium]|nr:hypothetical protein [Dongiaceae bacterium]